MTDLIRICPNEVDVTDPTRICSKYNSMVDFAEISDNDVCMMISHARGTMLASEEDQALSRQVSGVSRLKPRSVCRDTR